jgi:hypothetical protein
MLLRSEYRFVVEKASALFSGLVPTIDLFSATDGSNSLCDEWRTVAHSVLDDEEFSWS